MNRLNTCSAQRAATTSKRLIGSLTSLCLTTLLLLALCAGGGVVATAQTRAAAAGTAAKVKPALAHLFGANVAAATEFKPYFLVGDFNGDALEDLAVLVHNKKSAGLPAGVTRLNPWGYERRDSVGTSDLALAIIHGASGGWDAPSPLALYLLADREFFSTPIWEAHQDVLLSLSKKAPPQRGRRATAKAARGDAIGLATEAGTDARLYWNGKTYKLAAPDEEP